MRDFLISTENDVDFRFIFHADTKPGRMWELDDWLPNVNQSWESKEL